MLNGLSTLKEVLIVVTLALLIVYLVQLVTA